MSLFKPIPKVTETVASAFRSAPTNKAPALPGPSSSSSSTPQDNTTLEEYLTQNKSHYTDVSPPTFGHGIAKFKARASSFGDVLMHVAIPSARLAPYQIGLFVVIFILLAMSTEWNVGIQILASGVMTVFGLAVAAQYTSFGHKILG